MYYNSNVVRPKEEELVDKALHGLAPDSIQLVILKKARQILSLLNCSVPPKYCSFNINTLPDESLKSKVF